MAGKIMEEDTLPRPAFAAVSLSSLPEAPVWVELSVSQWSCGPGSVTTCEFDSSDWAGRTGSFWLE